MREIRRILASVPGLEVVEPDEVGIEYTAEEEDLEPYATFEENALSKARWFAERSGIPTVADDSGITVDALAGAPGVRSKRFAADADASAQDLQGQARDDANNRRLVELLKSTPPERRTARYVCVLAFVTEDGDPQYFRGEAPGLVIDDARGENGFGYDPFIFHTELGRTYAEMTSDEKDARSHRGAAFRGLAAALREGMGRAE